MDEIQTLLNQMNPAQLDRLKTLIVEREFALGAGKYSTAKVYNVIHNKTGVIAYTGSTIKELSLRWAGHKSFFKMCPDSAWSQYVAQNGGPEEFSIVLIKNCPCRSLRELLEIERDCITTYEPVCNVMLTALRDTEVKWEKLTRKLLMRDTEQQLLKRDAVHLQVKILPSFLQDNESVLLAILGSEPARRFFINCLAEVGIPLQQTRFRSEAPTEKQLEYIRQLCTLLGLSHSRDQSSTVDQNVLNAQLDNLATVVKQYQTDLNVRQSTANRNVDVQPEKSKTPAQVLKLNIDTVLKHFSGTYLKGSFTRSRSNGQVRQYKYKIETLDSDIDVVLSCLK